MSPLSITALRRNLFKVVDQVLETGVPVEIERYGKKLLLLPVEPVSKLANLPRRQVIIGDPEDLVDLRVSVWHERLATRPTTDLGESAASLLEQERLQRYGECE